MKYSEIKETLNEGKDKIIAMVKHSYNNKTDKYEITNSKKDVLKALKTYTKQHNVTIYTSSHLKGQFSVLKSTPLYTNGQEDVREVIINGKKVFSEMNGGFLGETKN